MTESLRRYPGMSIGYLTMSGFPIDDEAEQAAEDDYRAAQAWSEWLTRHVPENLFMVLWIEEREDMRFRYYRARPEPSLSCYAPAWMFLGRSRHQREVFRELRRNAFVHAAKRVGWPEPPPLPPYHGAPDVPVAPADDGWSERLAVLHRERPLSRDMERDRYWEPDIGCTRGVEKSGFEIDGDQIADALIDYYLDPAWYRWMTDVLPKRTDLDLWVRKREGVTFEFGSKKSAKELCCDVPVSLFSGEGERHREVYREVYREIRREMFVRMAQRAGWPEPPPLPPYHETT